MPVWKNELYLAYHRGCYTSQSETKKLIRQNEELLENAEKFAALAMVTAGRPYSNGDFEEIWKRVLFDQFHDIMPGSGIGVNYADAARNLEDASLRSRNILDDALSALGRRIDSRGAGIPVVVYNPLSWDRSGPVEIDVVDPPAGQHYEARDSAGQPLASQMADGKLAVLVKSVPAMGYQVIHLTPTANARPAASTLKVNGMAMENEFLRIAIDPHTGCVTSLVEKPGGHEAMAPGGCGNLIQAFKDVPRTQDAWEIRFDEDEWDLKQPQSVRVIEQGPERAVVRVANTFRNSTIQQDLTVYAGVPARGRAHAYRLARGPRSAEGCLPGERALR